jgi:hypothetical protein
MRILKGMAVLALTVGALSCVWSLQPLFEESDLIIEPGLVGTWKTADNEDTWTFEKIQNGKEYVLVYRQAEFGPDGPFSEGKLVPGDAARFQARLGRLGGRLFLDLIPVAEGNPGVRNELFNWHLIRAHTICRLWLEKDALRLDWLSENWLEEGFTSGKITIAHARAEDGWVVTAPTKELQQAVARYAEDNDAFPPSEDILRRVK